MNMKNYGNIEAHVHAARLEYSIALGEAIADELTTLNVDLGTLRTSLAAAGDTVDDALLAAARRWPRVWPNSARPLRRCAARSSPSARRRE